MKLNQLSVSHGYKGFITVVDSDYNFISGKRYLNHQRKIDFDKLINSEIGDREVVSISVYDTHIFIYIEAGGE